MKKMTPAANPDAYVETLAGSWQHDRVVFLRRVVRAVPSLQEEIKWGHLVYSADGPVLLIRAEDNRVLFGFWHGRHLLHLEPRLKPSGKYHMATLELKEDTEVDQAIARRLVEEAVALHQELGDPRLAAKQKKPKP